MFQVKHRRERTMLLVNVGVEVKLEKIRLCVDLDERVGHCSGWKMATGEARNHL